MTKTIDFLHQTEAFDAGKDREFFAYFLDPGTGKTKVTLDDAMYNFKRGRIDALLVIAPNSVKTSWVSWPHQLESPEDQDQVERWLGTEQVIKGVHLSNPKAIDKRAWAGFEQAMNDKSRLAKSGNRKLIVLAVNFEALLSDQVFDFLADFCKTFRTMIALDESTRIGEPGSKRTKKAIKLGRLATLRRILSGTPVLKSPMKIFSQGKFLGEAALGFKSFYTFRNRYAIMGGFEMRQIIGHDNLDELSDKIAKWSYRKTADECLDLPPAIFLKRRVDLSDEQARAYKSMQKEFYANIDGTEITASIVLAQMTRLQQILGGYVQQDDKIVEIIPPSRNPKLKEALALVEAAPGQVVIWFKFRPELQGMADLLREAKISFYEFHGDVDDGERVKIRKSFQRGERQVLLGTASTGGIGIDEFKVANVVIYVSNDFDTEKRKQADDRNRRIGSNVHKSITYYDIIVPGTVDTKILSVLRSDAKLSAKVLRENFKEWI